jgi:hypothetical protein
VELFIQFDRHGKILSVSKVEQMHESLEHPHGGLDKGDDVLKVKSTAELAALDAHEVVVQYSVDVKKRKLQKRRPPRGGA